MDIPTSKASCFYLSGSAPYGADCIGIRRPILTGIALIAFASNSLLCRWALGTASIDAVGFTSLRLATGAMVLWLLAAAASRSTSKPKTGGSIGSAALLFAYAITFSLAFLGLKTGTGALILFGSVQVTMFTAAFIDGKRPTLREVLGLCAALAGLVYLVLPGLDAPEPWAAGLMVLAGISWGGYSLRGHRISDPVNETAGNFQRTLPAVLLLGLLAHASLRFSPMGVLQAMLSGGASASGYIIWYAALRDLTAKHAGLVQLSVPLLAATGGVLFLSEPLMLRLIVAAVLILGGIAVAIAPLNRNRPVSSDQIKSEKLPS